MDNQHSCSRQNNKELRHSALCLLPSMASHAAVCFLFPSHKRSKCFLTWQWANKEINRLKKKTVKLGRLAAGLWRRLSDLSFRSGHDKSLLILCADRSRHCTHYTSGLSICHSPRQQTSTRTSGQNLLYFGGQRATVTITVTSRLCRHRSKVSVTYDH